MRLLQGSNYSFALRKLRSDFRFWRRKMFLKRKTAKQNFSAKLKKLKGREKRVKNLIKSGLLYWRREITHLNEHF